jgi:hypothetical protein
MYPLDSVTYFQLVLIGSRQVAKKAVTKLKNMVVEE